MSTVLAVIGAGATLFLGADAIHSGWTHHQMKKWEEEVERYPDGVRKGWREFSVGDGDPALLFVHGYGTGPSLYQDMAPLLAEEGAYGTALRLPGFGVPVEKSKVIEADQWVKEIHREVKQLAREHDRVWIVSHSLGGAVTLHYLLNVHTAAPVDGVVLLAPALKVSNERSPVLSPRKWFGFWKRCLLFTDVLKNDVPVRGHASDVKNKLTRSKFIPQNIFGQMFELITKVNKGDRGLNRPLLMVLAEHDGVIDNNRAVQFYESLKSPRRKLIRLQKSRHIIPLDAGMERTVSAIDEFIRGHERSHTRDKTKESATSTQ